MMDISRKNLDRQKSKSRLNFCKKKWSLQQRSSFSVFDNLTIPYPKRDFINDDDASDGNTAAAAHITKTDAIVVKAEPTAGLPHQQQSSRLNQSQPGLVHIKQQTTHSNLLQQNHSQQVNPAISIVH